MENAQTIHIHHTYRTSSLSSSLHNKPSWTFELLHANITTEWMHNFYFSHNMVTLNWNLTVEFSSLSGHTKFWNKSIHHVKHIFHKIMSTVIFLEYYLSKVNLAWVSTNQKVVAPDRISSKSILKFCKKLDTEVFDFLYICDIKWRSRSSKLISNCIA